MAQVGQSQLDTSCRRVAYVNRWAIACERGDNVDTNVTAIRAWEDRPWRERCGGTAAGQSPAPLQHCHEVSSDSDDSWVREIRRSQLYTAPRGERTTTLGVASRLVMSSASRRAFSRRWPSSQEFVCVWWRSAPDLMYGEALKAADMGHPSMASVGTCPGVLVYAYNVSCSSLCGGANVRWAYFPDAGREGRHRMTQLACAHELGNSICSGTFHALGRFSIRLYGRFVP
ncbi:hypothetical protein BD309DRAFT_234284 [Dichomitus squalens]|uniref:Uncharacterized protein n=1 Tax=Dichomitus squalens TaxID=114155 RepID=A0A4Q9NPP8_9APHY|nr:hypothetical protein BD309DRAFT_234284 [Dichomitus squalens]TBU60860.1 hypothetical protein BD310DRAFT_271284 [Dichomitus squalens]